MAQQRVFAAYQRYRIGIGAGQASAVAGEGTVAVGIYIQEMARGLSRHHRAPRIRPGGIIGEVVNIGLEKRQHLGWQRVYRQPVEQPVPIKSPGASRANRAKKQQR